MKIKRLIIKKLHKHYDYEVNFNDDITIIYGLNGSGKTTVLNILNMILSGNMYDLFDYSFKLIELEYSDANNVLKKLRLTNNNKRANRTITINDNGKEHNVNRGKVTLYGLFPEPSFESFEDMYPIIKSLKKRFNIIYLPLRRAYAEKKEKKVRGIPPIVIDSSEHEYEIDPIKQVEELIKSKYSEIEYKISLLNDEFRNNTIRLFSMQYAQEDFTSLKSLFENPDQIINRIQKIRNGYIKILREFDLMTPLDVPKYSRYFNDVLDKVNNIYQYKHSNDASIIFNLCLKLELIYRLENVIELADKLEEDKREVRRTFTQFVTVINEFLGKSSDEEKSLVVEGNRQVYIRNKFEDHISLNTLSSGEQQILILFTNLMFKLCDEPAVFIVDEPEMSLHLLWQRIFIDKIREVAPNVQIVFATHSPEIVSHYRNKMFKLSKNKVDDANE